MKQRRNNIVLTLAALFILHVAGCSSAYYGAMEKVGVHKRDILVDRVEGARDAQEEAQVQFKSALEQFDAVVNLEETDLKLAYERLSAEYDESEQAAASVYSRIRKVEEVSEDLFDEWEEELKLYQNKELQRSSKAQLQRTRQKYDQMLLKMQQAERSMQPVLNIFRDNVLYLKHNLNAQAIGSLQRNFSSLEGEITSLIAKMNVAIESSNAFIAEMR